MKKALSLLLVLVMLLSLCACGNSNNQSTEPSDFSQNTTESTETSTDDTTENTEVSTDDTTEATQDPTEEAATAPAEDPTTAPSEENDTKPADTSKPTDTSTPTHTHSYSAATCTQPKKCSCGATEGNALGHTWVAATCTVPKTCSVCKATEGSAVGHKWTNATCFTPKTCSVCEATEGNAAGHSWNASTCTTPKTCAICKKTDGNKAEHIVKGTTCKMCGQVVAVDPKNFNAEVSYVCVGDAGPHISEYDGQTYNLFTLTYLENDNWCYSMGGYVQSSSPNADWPQINGICYAPTAEWNGQSSGLNGGWSYQIIGSQIIISAEVDNFEYDYGMGNKATITCQLLSDGTLKVVSISGFAIPQKTGIKIGTIFYPTT